MNYHEINETAARRAREANSFRAYAAGSATAEYRSAADEAAALAEKQKQRTDPIYHDKIDRLLESYTKKLAGWYNRHFEIEARVPSMMISGGGNFPVRKKEKQNAARDKHMEEYNYISGLLDKIRSVGTGGISSDDENAVAKLEAKLSELERSQNIMKEVNAYYRRHKTLDGCTAITDEAKIKITAAMNRNWRSDPKPFESYSLTNNNANIRRVKERIAALKKRDEAPAADGWEFEGGRVVMNKGENRVQIIFDGKPDEETRAELKSRGFRWAPSQSAWQRQLNANGIYAAKQIKAIQRINKTDNAEKGGEDGDDA